MLRICGTVLLCGSVPLLMAQQPDLKVHHITIAGRDLKQMQSALAAAGIVTEYGGKGANGWVEIAFATFLDGSYLEIDRRARSHRTGAARHLLGEIQLTPMRVPCAWGLFSPDR